MQRMNTGTLYTIATPIGNLEDITYRAVRVLSELSLLACEDTRETRKILEHYDITGPTLVSYHAQSLQRVEDDLIRQLHEGAQIGLVSDRGTPGISDPGGRLIARCVAEGIAVVPIPGASAVITALQASGMDTSRFEYLGFLPHKKGRQTLLDYVMNAEQTVVCYESPHRILKTLDALSACTKQIVLGRELTKQYEEFLRGTAAELAETLRSRPAVKGEFVVIVSGT